MPVKNLSAAFASIHYHVEIMLMRTIGQADDNDKDYIGWLMVWWYDGYTENNDDRDSNWRKQWMVADDLQEPGWDEALND